MTSRLRIALAFALLLAVVFPAASAFAWTCQPGVKDTPANEQAGLCVLHPTPTQIPTTAPTPQPTVQTPAPTPPIVVVPTSAPPVSAPPQTNTSSAPSFENICVTSVSDNVQHTDIVRTSDANAYLAQHANAYHMPDIGNCGPTDVYLQTAKPTVAITPVPVTATPVATVESTPAPTVTPEATPTATATPVMTTPTATPEVVETPVPAVPDTGDGTAADEIAP